MCICNRRIRVATLLSVNLLICTLMLTACGSTNVNANNNNKNSGSSHSSSDTKKSSTDISANVALASPQVILGTSPCPETVSSPTHWDAIVGTQSGVSAVGRVTCANLIGNATLQALILVGYQGTGNVVDIYVYNNITSPSPTQIFKLQNLYKGDARISGHNTILTAEVDQDSSINKNAGGNNALQPDLFREFQWSGGAGTFVPIAFPGIFPVLTRYQAEDDQQQVNQGHQPWQTSASMTAQALVANLLKWSPDSPATITRGGDQNDVEAAVDVTNKSLDGGTIHVVMSRLYGKIGNIWIATEVTSDGMSIISPAAYERLVSPANVAGTSKAVGGKAGTIHIFDHTQTDIGHADVQPSQGNGSITYSVSVSYNTTFKTGTQEGMVALYLPNSTNDSISAAVIVKVLLG
jgi:hypothetical protein